MLHKRLWFGCIALAMILTLLVGCGTPAPEATPTVAPTEVATQESDMDEAEPTEEPTAAPTDTPIPPTPTTAPPVTIGWHIIPQRADDEDLLVHMEEVLSAMLQERGVNVQLDLITHGWDYGEQANMMFTAGEECDIVFTASWTNEYLTRVANGDFMPLDEMLPQYATETWDKYSDPIWDSLRFEGEIYAVPNQQNWTIGWGPFVRTDILEKYPLDWDSVKTLRDLEPWMDEVLAGEPQLHTVFAQPYLAHPFLIGGYQSVAGAPRTWVGIDDPDRQAMPIYAVPEFSEFLKLTREWTDAGYIPDVDITDEEIIARWEAGEFAGDIHGWSPKQIGVQDAKRGGYVFEGKSLHEPVMTDVSGTMSAICRTSQHPELALQVINVANTDPEFYRTLVWGVEGEQWEWDDPEQNLVQWVEGYDASTVPYILFDWMMGDTFQGMYFDTKAAEIDPLALAQQSNENATYSNVFGFVFNPQPVETEIAQVNAIDSEAMGPLTESPVEEIDLLLEEAQEMMEAAGMDVIIEEVQRQIDAWAATLE